MSTPTEFFDLLVDEHLDEVEDDCLVVCHSPGLLMKIHLWLLSVEARRTGERTFNLDTDGISDTHTGKNLDWLQGLPRDIAIQSLIYYLDFMTNTAIIF